MGKKFLLPVAAMTILVIFVVLYFLKTQSVPALVDAVPPVPKSTNVATTTRPIPTFEKDITGDGIPELFVLEVENGHGNKWYEIYRQMGESYVSIQLGNDKTISFDDIEYRDGFIYSTDHANDMSSKNKLKLDGDVLVPIKTAAFFLAPTADDPNGCDVRLAEGSSLKYQTLTHKDNCSIWTDDLDMYLEN